MTDLILHHYWGSPYAEKVRLALGYKNSPWRSREIAVTPPRPSLATVLGAFRRTPVLQIGADYVCDTRLILDVIEIVCPGPSLEPANDRRAVSDLIRGWAEPRVFTMLGAIRFQSEDDVAGIFDRQVSIANFSADRLPFMRPAYEPERFRQLRDPARDHLERYLTVLDNALSDGRSSAARRRRTEIFPPITRSGGCARPLTARLSSSPTRASRPGPTALKRSATEASL